MAGLVGSRVSQWFYGCSYTVLGYVVQVAAQQPFDLFLREKLFSPLLMEDTAFYAPIQSINRFAAQYTVNPTNNQLVAVIRPRMDPFQAYRVPSLVLGGAGLVSTADDYGRFTQMLLNGGHLGGVRILELQTVELMWRNHLTSDLLPFQLSG